jgi:hypothetical protein
MAASFPLDCIEVICTYATPHVLCRLARTNSDVSNLANKQLYSSIRLRHTPDDPCAPLRSQASLKAIQLDSAGPLLRKHGTHVQSLSFVPMEATYPATNHQELADKAAEVLVQCLPFLPSLRHFGWEALALPCDDALWAGLANRLRSFTLNLALLEAARDAEDPDRYEQTVS